AASRLAALPYRSASRWLPTTPTRRPRCCARPTKPCIRPRAPDATGSRSATRTLLHRAAQPLSPVPHRRVELPERGERAVAGEHRRLGVVGRGDTLEAQVDDSSLALDRDEVS